MGRVKGLHPGSSKDMVQCPVDGCIKVKVRRDNWIKHIHTYMRGQLGISGCYHLEVFSFPKLRKENLVVQRRGGRRSSSRNTTSRQSSAKSAGIPVTSRTIRPAGNVRPRQKEKVSMLFILTQKELRAGQTVIPFNQASSSTVYSAGAGAGTLISKLQFNIWTDQKIDDWTSRNCHKIN